MNPKLLTLLPVLVFLCTRHVTVMPGVIAPVWVLILAALAVAVAALTVVAVRLIRRFTSSPYWRLPAGVTITGFRPAWA